MTEQPNCKEIDCERIAAEPPAHGSPVPACRKTGSFNNAARWDFRCSNRSGCRRGKKEAELGSAALTAVGSPQGCVPLPAPRPRSWIPLFFFFSPIPSFYFYFFISHPPSKKFLFFFFFFLRLIIITNRGRGGHALPQGWGVPAGERGPPGAGLLCPPFACPPPRQPPRPASPPSFPGCGKSCTARDPLGIGRGSLCCCVFFLLPSLPRLPTLHLRPEEIQPKFSAMTALLASGFLRGIPASGVPRCCSL